MGVLLLIFKIILWILLVLLGLILVVVAVVLFCPIRYEVQAEQTEPPSARMDIQWLFRGIQFQLIYKHDAVYSLKLFGKEVFAEKSKQKKNKKTKKKPKKRPTTQYVPPDDVILTTREKTMSQSYEPSQPQPQKQPQKTMVILQKTENQTKTIRRISLSDIEEQPPQQQSEEINESEEYFFTGESKNSTQTKKKTWDWKKEFLKFPYKWELVQQIGTLLKRVTKAILPQNFQLHGTVGTGEPELTGYLLAVCGILKYQFGDGLQIRGDFSQATVKNIYVSIKGRLILGEFLIAFVRFTLSKPMRHLTKQIWKGRKYYE